MGVGQQRAERLFFMPASSDSRTQRHAVTDASASIAVVMGGYELYLETTSLSGATCKVGATAVVPTADAAEIAGFYLPPNTPYSLEIKSGETALHALMNLGSATGTLRLTRLY